MNVVMCIGRLTRDVELKYSKSGTAMGFSSIALNEFYTDNKEINKRNLLILN